MEACSVNSVNSKERCPKFSVSVCLEIRSKSPRNTLRRKFNVTLLRRSKNDSFLMRIDKLPFMSLEMPECAAKTIYVAAGPFLRAGRMPRQTSQSCPFVGACDPSPDA